MFSPDAPTIQLRYCVLALLLMPALAARALEPIEEHLRRRIEALPEHALARDVHVADSAIFTTLYAANGFRPLWTKRAGIDALIDLVTRAEEEGLTPRDYHAESLAALLAEIDRDPKRSHARRVDFELLLTDSLLRYVYHLRFGKVDPVTLDPRWNFRRDIGDRAALAKLVVAFGAEDLEGYLAAVLPRSPYYLRLKQALARKRARKKSRSRN